MTQPNRRVLVIDDTPSIHADFRKILARDPGARLDTVETSLFGSAVQPAAGRFEVASALDGAQGERLAAQVAVAAVGRRALALDVHQHDLAGALLDRGGPGDVHRAGEARQHADRVQRHPEAHGLNGQHDDQHQRQHGQFGELRHELVDDLLRLLNHERVNANVKVTLLRRGEKRERYAATQERR